jgi:hypothetical protein
VRRCAAEIAFVSRGDFNHGCVPLVLTLAGSG